MTTLDVDSWTLQLRSIYVSSLPVWHFTAESAIELRPDRVTNYMLSRHWYQVRVCHTLLLYVYVFSLTFCLDFSRSGFGFGSDLRG